MLTSKLCILLNISAPLWQIFTRLLYQWFFWSDNWNEGQYSYVNFKTAHFVTYFSSTLTNLHQTSISGILLIRQLIWGATVLCLLENWMLCYIFQLDVDGFSWHFYIKDSFDEIIKMRGNNPMLTSKLHALLHISAPCWWIFTILL